MAYESPWQDPNQQYYGGSTTYDNSGTGQIAVDNFDNYGSQNGNNSGFDWGGFGNWLLGNVNTNTLGALPLAGMAGQQFYNANQYRDLGNQAAQMADPFGLQNRKMYQGLLSDIYNDPTKFLNSPGHQAVVQSGMNAIQARNRASGYMGSGKDQTDLGNYLASENAKYLDNQKALLAQLSGAQFDPANAAGMLMKSGQMSLDAQNNALGALGYLGRETLGQPMGTVNRPGIPQSMMGTATQGAGQAAGGLMNMFNKGGGFTPDLSSSYWGQYTPQNYNFNDLANQQMQVTQGNTGLGNTGYDEFGGSIDQWGNPMGTNYDIGPYQDFGGGGYDLGSDWIMSGDGSDLFSWYY